MKIAQLFAIVGLLGLSLGAAPVWADEGGALQQTAQGATHRTAMDRPILLASDDDDYDDEDRYERHGEHGDRDHHGERRNHRHGDGNVYGTQRHGGPFMSILGLIGVVLVILAAG